VPSQLRGRGWKPVLFVKNIDDVPDFFMVGPGRGEGMEPSYGVWNILSKRSPFSTNSTFYVYIDI
jgi:hypothetical protein